MTREERAKQFAPFDAMKGLSAALRDREERHTRTERRELAEEEIARLSALLSRLRPGMRIRIRFFHAFHELEREGTLTEISAVGQYLSLEEDRIDFENIYEIKITEYDPKTRQAHSAPA